MRYQEKLWIGGLAIFVGIPAVIVAAGQMESDPPPVVTSAATDSGPRPDTAVEARLLTLLRLEAHDPDSVQQPELGDAASDFHEGQACWRVPFRFRAKNRVGALVLSRGVAWVKDGRILRCRVVG